MPDRGERQRQRRQRRAHVPRAVTPSQPLAAGDYVLRVGARAGAGVNPVARDRPPRHSGGARLSRRDLRSARSGEPGKRRPRICASGGTSRCAWKSRRRQLGSPSRRGCSIATGKPLAVPVTAAVRDDADGSRWHTAQLALAPLAPGDYVIEMAAGQSEERRSRRFASSVVIRARIQGVGNVG